ncbi:MULTISPECIES: hypothetical protein [unclassified Klebsiella]|uniref:hypothetical protein n=1 Tax=unclassified Klebsiella TaxID=2608929 RepID=UPI0024DE29EE|nr:MULTISPECIES: hypothetical protein [unclassified Klebsiella]MDK1844516.1 hypothetical protein [Klebsiella sp. K5-1]MDK1941433.1 hypothetical protein [Klebsiella sp. K4-32]MDK1969789.1 hypothetical protein [Klebsiella sp. K5-45]MDK2001093.1 hypothetical protein [Klebsiella sp. K4-44]
MTITLQAVNELIASLESAGELSIREQKFLKLAKEFSICSASLDAAIKTGNMLADQNAQLAAENVALVEALEKAQTINAAAEKLVRCKGRYHSEQNYRALAALFGVNTPDLPPLDDESRAVTVKLTDINEYLAEVHDKTLNRAFRLLAEGVRSGDVAAMRAAGIKVEAE